MELWRNLSMKPEDKENFAPCVVNHERTGSRFVRIDCNPSWLRSSLPGIRQDGIRGLTLLDRSHEPTLRLTAHPDLGPEGWGSEVTVSVSYDDSKSFTLLLRANDVGREVWPNLTMEQGDPRYFQDVLKGGSKLLQVEDLRSNSSSPNNRPQEGSRHIQARYGRLYGGREGLAPSLVLRDRADQPTLRLIAAGTTAQDNAPQVTVQNDDQEFFSLHVQTNVNDAESHTGLTMAASSLELLDEAGQPTLRLTAPGPGTWSRRMSVIVERDGDRFSLKLQLPGGREIAWNNLTMDQDSEDYVEKVLNDTQNGPQWVGVRDLGSPSVFPANTPDPGAPNLQGGSGQLRAESRYVETVLNHPQIGSRHVRVEDLGSSSCCTRNIPDAQASNLVNGAAGLAGGLGPQHLSGENAPLVSSAIETADDCNCAQQANGENNSMENKWGLAALENVDEVSIVAIPDIVLKPVESPQYRQPLRCHVLEEIDRPLVPWPAAEYAPIFKQEQVERLQRALINHCERELERVAILDAPPELVNPNVLLENVLEWRAKFNSKFAACYYPWLRVPDPLRRDGGLREVPPSAYIAGVYARVDQQVGVHKPPANEQLQNVSDTNVPVDDLLHGELNEQHVNVIRPYSGRGIRVAGARMLSRELQWRYVNVRRLMIMISKSIRYHMNWVVFEPNNVNLWRDVTRGVVSFLDGLWQRNMLDGETAEEAYTVNCNETTNPPQETDLGRMICYIQVLPPWPAEKVIIRIGFTESGPATLRS